MATNKFRLLVISNSRFESSEELAGRYGELRNGQTLSDGRVVEIVYSMAGSLDHNDWSSNWDTHMLSGSIQAYIIVNKMTWPEDGDFDAVLLSSHFPIRVYDGKYVSQEDIMIMAGGCSLEYFLSKKYYNNKPVFRLDGSTGGAEMLAWLDRVEAAKNKPFGQCVIDSDPGIQYRDYDESFIDAYNWLQEHAFDAILDEDKSSPTFDPARKYGLYIGWYDEYMQSGDGMFTAPESLFKNGDWDGAFGWHVRSSTFRNRGEYHPIISDAFMDNWVTGAIKNGFAFTMGSVYEPGLMSFARQTEFLERVFANKEPVGLAAWNAVPDSARDAYHHRMAYVGDPLWSPYWMGQQEQPPIVEPVIERELIRSFRLSDGNDLELWLAKRNS